MNTPTPTPAKPANLSAIPTHPDTLTKAVEESAVPRNGIDLVEAFERMIERLSSRPQEIEQVAWALSRFDRALARIADLFVGRLSTTELDALIESYRDVYAAWERDRQAELRAETLEAQLRAVEKRARAHAACVEASASIRAEIEARTVVAREITRTPMCFPRRPSGVEARIAADSPHLVGLDPGRRNFDEDRLMAWIREASELSPEALAWSIASEPPEADKPGCVRDAFAMRWRLAQARLARALAAE